MRTRPVAVNLGGSDANVDALTFEVLTLPQHGTLTGAGASRSYAPALDFHGSDSFTYRAHDGFASSAPATVTITVNPVDDPITIDPVDPPRGVER